MPDEGGQIGQGVGGAGGGASGGSAPGAGGAAAPAGAVAPPYYIDPALFVLFSAQLPPPSGPAIRDSGSGGGGLLPQDFAPLPGGPTTSVYDYLQYFVSQTTIGQAPFPPPIAPPPAASVDPYRASPPFSGYPFSIFNYVVSQAQDIRQAAYGSAMGLPGYGQPPPPGSVTPAAFGTTQSTPPAAQGTPQPLGFNLALLFSQAPGPQPPLGYNPPPPAPAMPSFGLGSAGPGPPLGFTPPGPFPPPITPADLNQAFGPGPQSFSLLPLLFSTPPGSSSPILPAAGVMPPQGFTPSPPIAPGGMSGAPGVPTFLPPSSLTPPPSIGLGGLGVGPPAGFTPPAGVSPGGVPPNGGGSGGGPVYY